MEVEKYKEEYPEKNLRERQWFSIEEAIETISLPEVGEMIRILSSKIFKY